MSKKKRFGISEALTRGLTETINVVENNSGTYRNVVLPLSRIELDPENPRKLSIDLNDVRQGIKSDDSQYERKQEELERLKELAHTIKTSGVINPVVVYKRGEVYRIVAGERRCLASILANKQEIEARVFNEKPKGFDLKLIQWIENTAREDLSLSERLDNVQDIITEYQSQFGPTEVTASLLKTITGLSLSQTTYYLAAIQAPDDVRKEIHNGKITNLDKAALIANVNSPEVRKTAIQACLEGASLKSLRLIINQQKQFRPQIVSQPKSRGRTHKRIHLGFTTKSEVVKTIVDRVLKDGSLKSHHQHFTKIEWQDFKQATKAFKKMMDLLEETVG